MQLISFLGEMANPKIARHCRKMKRSMFGKEFSNLLQSFSMAKCKRVISHPLFSNTFTIFVSSGAMRKFIMETPTLNGDLDVFLDTAHHHLL